MVDVGTDEAVVGFVGQRKSHLGCSLCVVGCPYLTRGPADPFLLVSGSGKDGDQLNHNVNIFLRVFSLQHTEEFIKHILSPRINNQ